MFNLEGDFLVFLGFLEWLEVLCMFLPMVDL